MIAEYTVKLDEKRHPFLVKEKEFNYADVKLDAPEAVVQMLSDCFHLSDLAEEYVFMIALNSKAVPVGVFEVSHGCVNASLICPREIYIRALLAGAVGIIIVHNHPSGDVTPSKEDIASCARIKEAGNIIGIKLYDFIIVGNGTHVSFCEAGLIDDKKT